MAVPVGAASAGHQNEGGSTGSDTRFAGHLVAGAAVGSATVRVNGTENVAGPGRREFT